MKQQLIRPLKYRTGFLRFPIYFRSLGWDLNVSLSPNQIPLYFNVTQTYLFRKLRQHFPIWQKNLMPFTGRAGESGLLL